MLSLMDGVEAKLRRADHHLKALEETIQRFRDSHPYRIVSEDDLDIGKRLYRAQIVKRPPVIDWAMVIGDWAHNLRSALDQLALSLAWAYTKDALPARYVENSSFPIYVDRDLSPETLKRRVGKIHPDAKAIVKDVQPYGRRDNQRLAYLHRISNQDKHRAPLLTAGFVSSVTYWGEDDVRPVLSPTFENGAIVVYRDIPADLESNVDPDITFDIAFAESAVPRGMSVTSTLPWIAAFVRERVVDRLRPFVEM